MRKFSLAITAVVMLAGGQAVAADLSYPVKAPPPAMVAPLPSWNGFYIGIMGGYAAGNAFSNSPDGGFVGGTIGYNFQPAGTAFVFGVEGDLAWADISGAFVGGTSRIDWIGTLRGRVGYAFNNLLIYGTGGVAFASNRITLAGIGNDSQDHIGYALGGGLEWQFSPAWSAKVEYLYIDLGREPYFNNAFRSGGFVQTVKFGVNYRFNWGAPVMASY